MPIVLVKMPLRDRFLDALPHFGAVGLSLIAYFALVIPMAGIDEISKPLGLVGFVGLMASPIIGAVLVLRMQRRPGGLQTAVVKPYVRGFLVAAVAGLILLLEGVFPFFNENPVGVGIVAAAFLTWIVVPFVVPALRLLMWLISPPASL